MHNDALDRLVDYPFDRLRTLLSEAEPPAGLEPVIMSLGEPQHAPPPLIAEAISGSPNDWGKYPPIAGSADLLDAIRIWLTERYRLPDGFVGAESHILAVSGTREALYMTGDLAIPRAKGGRKPAVLIPNPFYQVYQGTALMAGAKPVYLSATADTNFLPDFDAVDEQTLARTVLAFLCSPANPQGTIAGAGYLENAIRLAQKHDFVLAVDECYAEIYDARPPAGALEVAAGMGASLDNILVFHSLSKRSSCPGLRSGFVAGDPALIRRLRTLRNYGGASLPLPVMAASAALWRDEAHVEVNRALYRRKFDIADRLLAGKLGHYRPDGGFYLWLDVGDGEEAALKLWREAAIRVIPGTYLSREDAAGLDPGKPYIRIALVQAPETIEIALTRVRDCLIS